MEKIRWLGLEIWARVFAFLMIGIGCIVIYLADERFGISQTIPIFAGAIGSMYSAVIYEIYYVRPKERKNRLEKEADEIAIKKRTFSMAYQVICQSESEIARKIERISGSITTLARMISDRKAKKELNGIAEISTRIVSNFDQLKNEIHARTL